MDQIYTVFNLFFQQKDEILSLTGWKCVFGSNFVSPTLPLRPSPRTPQTTPLPLREPSYSYSTPYDHPHLLLPSYTPNLLYPFHILTTYSRSTTQLML